MHLQRFQPESEVGLLHRYQPHTAEGHRAVSSLCVPQQMANEDSSGKVLLGSGKIRLVWNVAIPTSMSPANIDLGKFVRLWSSSKAQWLPCKDYWSDWVKATHMDYLRY